MADVIDLDYVSTLYRTHATDLGRLIEQQRRFRAATAAMTPQLDDIEAEITYLLLRDTRPERVMELGTFHGWSTTWILSALRDSGSGHLHSFDRIDNVVRNVPDGLADGRWTFVHGDVRERLADVPRDADYLFVDAAHTASFARWYLAELLPLVAAGAPVSVHDVHHGRRVLPLTEGAVLMGWMRERGVTGFTASRRRAPAAFAQLVALREELGLHGARGTTRNPMLWFTMPGSR
ncbi:class I SAM-dependent methyltransferase [Pseudonocardia sp.]|uniref:class I SAM-dependent methyltransferase n=1 Tax=Pseudonocardia sp. TaxID=60912 RepID=UPI002615E932|nr:class I SAM-dependent methyltransferase [Pseudonocardia sp.]